MQQNFSVRWFNIEKDIQLLSSELKEKFIYLNQKNSNNLSQYLKLLEQKHNNSNPLNQYGGMFMQNQNIIDMSPTTTANANMQMYPNYQMNIPQNVQMSPFYQNPNFVINQMQLIQNQSQNPIKNIQQGQFINSQFNINKSQFTFHEYDFDKEQQNETKSSKGKFTCKFEILIPNDQEFQVVRKLIGSKGCNMKKIIDACKTDPNSTGNVKLRLRGKGSGFKEGLKNKESDEPLHLCISTKDQESFEKATKLVIKLFESVYEEYKKYCKQIGIIPLPRIANKVESKNHIYKK